IQGPNALLYGTGNFGGVVNYITKRPQNRAQGSTSIAYGSHNFIRGTIDVTGPLLETLSYRVVGAAQENDSHIDHRSESNFYISPSLLWRPTKTTEIFVQTEFSKSEQNGFGFRALRAAQGTGAT